MIRLSAVSLSLTQQLASAAGRISQRHYPHSAFVVYRRRGTAPSTPSRTFYRGQELFPSSQPSGSGYTRLYSKFSSRLDGLDGPTVWQEFSPLATEFGAVNLGQGFPDWNPPAFATEAFMSVLRGDGDGYNPSNQYCRPEAYLPLAKELAEEYSTRWRREIDPITDVAVTTGCTGAMFCAFQGLLNPGDEVILMEPAFDIYSSQIIMAGGIPVYVPLRPTRGDDGAYSSSASECFKLDPAELAAAITPRTRVVVVNTPHNPTGKVFSRSELASIAEVVRANPGVLVISDEVYEHIIFDQENSPHISIATLDGMWGRTLTLSSSGKTFSATGWKVGWAVGPPELVRPVSASQQWVSFSAPTVNQAAVALCLKKAREPYETFDTYYDHLAAEYGRKRGLLVDAMGAAGIRPIVPEGGFFIMGDTSDIKMPASCLEEPPTAASPRPMPRDWAMSRWMTKEAGVTTIPPSAFFSKPNVHLADDFLRFAFCKQDGTLVEAKKRFEKYFK